MNDRPLRPRRANIAFVPLAMPLMFGPGAIATILGMTSTIKQSSTELASFVAVVAAILATMLVTYLCLAYAGKLSEKLGAMGIDATTRIVGFFVSAMGVALIFNGVIEVLDCALNVAIRAGRNSRPDRRAPRYAIQ
jgi:multiple antibiotic resistance protein